MKLFCVVQEQVLACLKKCEGSPQLLRLLDATIRSGRGIMGANLQPAFYKGQTIVDDLSDKWRKDTDFLFSSQIRGAIRPAVKHCVDAQKFSCHKTCECFQKLICLAMASGGQGLYKHNLSAVHAPPSPGGSSLASCTLTVSCRSRHHSIRLHRSVAFLLRPRPS